MRVCAYTHNQYEEALYCFLESYGKSSEGSKSNLFLLVTVMTLKWLSILSSLHPKEMI